MRPADNVEKLVKKMRYQSSKERRKEIFDNVEVLLDNNQRQEPAAIMRNIWRMMVGSRVGSLVALLLIVSSLVTCFVLSRKNANLKDELELARRDIANTPINDSVTINFYLKEHQDLIARQASLNSAALQAIQMQISPDDLLYYELFGNQPEFMSRGIIVRGPSSQQEIESSESPAISDGQTLTLSEARDATDFNLVSPSWLHPGYRLDQIMRISGRDAMHLLYTNSINSVSLFEQPLDGLQKLSPHDLREYAVYQNEGQAGGAILTWRDNTLSYVLIGNIEISQLMNIAQSISAEK